MSALTAARRTKAWLRPESLDIEHTLKASTTIQQGSIVQLDANGLAIPASKAANQLTAGMALDHAESGATGDTFVTVRSGVFRWDILAGDPVTRADIGKDVYIEDDQTIRRQSNANSTKAGRLLGVDAQGAWVATGLLYNY